MQRIAASFDALIMFYSKYLCAILLKRLNLYGFRRLTQGPDAGAYYHELFLRGRPQLCLRMQRQKVKGTGHKQPADAKTEPNFYTMAPSTYTSPLMSASSPEATSSKEEDSRPLGITYQEMSPGMAGLHGAAHLLKNIAAGVRTSSMGASFSLGESAISSAPLHGGSNVASLPVSPPSSLLVPEGKSNLIYPSSRDQSMSLLGRVNSEQYNPTQSHSSPPSQFAFFWPPDRQKQNPLMDGKEALSPQEIIPPPSQQESAQPTSSHFFKKERANLQASERSIIKAQIETADDEIKVKISDPNTPFSSFGESNEGGRMETKVSNGIETEEV